MDNHSREENLRPLYGGKGSESEVSSLLQNYSHLPPDQQAEVKKLLLQQERSAILHAITDGLTIGKVFFPPPYYWVTHCTKTFDEKWKEKKLSGPYSHFPSKPYFPWLFRSFVECRRLFVPKSREMMLTWAVISYIVWHCQLYPRTRAIIQCQKEDKAADLVKGGDAPGYVRTLYEMQEPWMQNQFPLSKPMGEQHQLRIAWRNGSVIQGVAWGRDQVRQYHPTIYFCDEAGFVTDFEGAYGAADPVAAQIIAVSSANPGYFFDVVENTLGAG